MADAIKAKANAAFSASKFAEATELYSEAIAIDGSNAVLYSNRSAAKTGARDYAGALEDAEKAIEIDGAFVKGYARKGAALHGLKRYEDAVMAYESGLQKSPDNEILTRGLAEVKRAMDRSEEGQGGGDMAGLFKDPNMLGKLASNPKTAKFMQDPAFVSKMQALQSGKADMTSMMADPRMMTALGVVMGIDMEAFERPEGSNQMPPGYAAGGKKEEEGDEMPGLEPAPAASTSSSTPKAAKAAPAPKAAPPAPEPAAADPDADAKKAADEAKARGNASYKARKFEDAVGHYQKAWDTYPKDITYLTNLAAVYFEQGDYTKCIETCEKAVEEGRELRADYKLIAKAFGRIGTAHAKLGDLSSAINFYSKSLTEHRTPDILGKLREAEKAKAEADKQAYIDPEQAEKAREEGNTAFKAGDFAGAVKAYSEAVKRLPTDPRAYNNRAAAYTKLAALPEALKDAEAAIAIDPSIIKAYIRKSLVEYGMREYTKALETCQAATDKDVEKAHTREIEGQMQKCLMEIQAQRSGESDEQTYARAMRDPEVAEIMNDPVMRQILQDSQSDPRALRDHMKNPAINAKVQKLINAGIIKTR